MQPALCPARKWWSFLFWVLQLCSILFYLKQSCSSKWMFLIFHSDFVENFFHLFQAFLHIQWVWGVWLQYLNGCWLTRPWHNVNILTQFWVKTVSIENISIIDFKAKVRFSILFSIHLTMNWIRLKHFLSYSLF